MLRHLFSGLLLLSALTACEPAVMQQGSPKLQQAEGFSTPTNTVKLSTLPQENRIIPGVNAPAEIDKTVRVGLLVPLTGRNAEIGRAMQDAATVALYDKYASLSLRESTVRVELLPKDTGDTPEQAAAAAAQAIAEGAVFLIGPTFGDATEAATPAARTKNIPILSLSNNVPHADKNVIAFGFSPQEQTARIINFAMKAGKNRIAVLVPNTPLGALVLATAKETLATKGLTLVAQGTYGSQGLKIDAAVNQLMPSGRVEFDALLIPESGAPLGTILRTLATRGITPQNVQFLGTGIWDDTALLRRVSLDGAWLASLPPESTALFETRFRNTYHYVPPRIAGLAYDAVSLAVTLATSGHTFDAATLTNEAGFIGPANGIFRLRPSGKTERGLAVLRINNGAFEVLDPAPNAFVGK